MKANRKKEKEEKPGDRKKERVAKKVVPKSDQATPEEKEEMKLRKVEEKKQRTAEVEDPDLASWALSWGYVHFPSINVVDSHQ